MPEFNQQYDLDIDINHFDQLYPSITSSYNNQYYDSNKFNSSFSVNGVNDLRVIHLNIRSISANGDSFVAFLSTLNLSFDIICVSETWTTDPSSFEGFLDGYTGVFSCREGRQGGGTAIFLKEHIEYSVIPHLTVNNDDDESVFVNITKGNKNLVVGCCYRPPSANPDLFRLFFEQNFTASNMRDVDKIILGDFNLCMTKINEDPAIASFYHTMNTLSLIPTISKPTRITGSSCSLIDNIFVSNLNNFRSGSLVVDLSDHLPVFLIYENFFQPEASATQSVKYRKITESTLFELHQALVGDGFREIYDCEDVDSAMELLHDKILENFNRCCPIKTKFISPKDDLKPWITNNVKGEIRKK